MSEVVLGNLTEEDTERAVEVLRKTVEALKRVWDEAVETFTKFFEAVRQILRKITPCACHLAFRARKARIRKKNMRRIFAWAEDK